MSTGKAKAAPKSSYGTTTTIDDMLSNGRDIWVINRSDRIASQNGRQASIFLSIEVNGKSAQCVIPVGPPILLTDQVPAKALAESSDLRRLIANNSLDLLDEARVNALPDDCVDKSRAALKKHHDSTRDGGATAKKKVAKKPTAKKPTDSLSQIDDGIGKGMTPAEIAELARTGSVTEETDDSQPSVAIVTLLNTFRDDAIDVSDVITQLESLRYSLTEADIEYVKSETTETEILDWLAEEVKSRETRE